MGELFEAFGFTFEKLEKEGEVALVKAFTATGRLVVPKHVEHEGRTYTITKVGGLSYPKKKRTTKQKWVEPEDKRRKGYYQDFTVWEDIDGDEVYYDSILVPLTPDGNFASEFRSVISVVLPDTIKEIGENCFKCSSLESINIPQGITEIPAGAFNRCSHLKSINIPSSVKSIGQSAFLLCELPTEITIPSSVKSIGQYAFFWYELGRGISIPSSVKSIEQYIFDNYRESPELKTINILNEECEVMVAPNAFPAGVEIKYLGKKEVKETPKKEDTQNASIPKEREAEVVKPAEDVKTQKETETPLQVKKDTTNKPVGVAIETTGKYTVQKNDNGSISVYEDGQLCSNTKEALRAIAAAINLEVDSNWTTRQLGAKVMKALK